VGFNAAPTFADIDGDGDLDAFVGENPGTVKFYRNTQFDAVAPGTGFVADVAGNPLAGFDVGIIAAPTFADIDGDGDLDAFVGEGNGTVKFFENFESNNPPVPTAPAITTNEDTPATSQIAPNDPNAGDTHTYAVTTAATNGTASVDAMGLTTYTPNLNFNGADSFVVTVTDAAVATGAVTINVTVNPVNDPPAPTAPAFISSEDTPAAGQVAHNDPDAGDTHTYAVTTAATNGAANVNAAGIAIYIPNANFNGVDSFVVTVTDATGATGNVTINVTVNAVNDAPVPTAPAITTSKATPGTSQVLPNDPDVGDTHTYAVTTAAANGVAGVDAAGLATYTPNTGFAGNDSFTVTVTDSAGATGTVTINVTVNVPAISTVGLSLNGTAFNSTTNNVMTLNATTVASNPVTNADVYVALQLPDGTLLVMQPDGSFSTTITPLLSNIPVPDFTGSIFSYTFTGAEPVGNYTWFAALTTPGSLNVIGTLAVQPFSFGP